MKAQLNKPAVKLLLSSLLCVSLVGCDHDEAPFQDPAQAQDADRPEIPAGFRGGQLALSIPLTPDLVKRVATIRYIIKDADGDVLGQEDVPVLENIRIPGGAPELEKNPLDPDSRHQFADYYTLLPEGDYAVEIFPLDASGNPAKDCSGMARDGISIQQSQTTEVTLLAQCKYADPGALDVIAAVNHEPQLLDLWWTSIDGGPESKFTCKERLRFCATVKDVDNDPLLFTTTSSSAGCSVQEDVSGAVDSNETCPKRTRCFIVDCDGKVGRANLNFLVRDQLWSKSKTLITKESWFQLAGFPKESRAELNFWGYFLDKDKCEPCPDCPKPVFYQSVEMMFLQDLSDSMKRILPTIAGQAQTLAADSRALLKVSGVSAGAAGVIDKPVMTGVNTDYVYKAFETIDSDPATLGNGYSAMSIGAGGDHSEAQLEALLHVAKTASAVGYSTPDEQVLRVAVVVTNSDFHEAMDCTAPTCSTTNNGDGVISRTEDYPAQDVVASAVAQAGIVPVFLLSPEQGAYIDEAPYLDFVNNKLSGKGVVVKYDPLNGDKLASKISDALRAKFPERFAS